ALDHLARVEGQLGVARVDLERANDVLQVQLAAVEVQRGHAGDARDRSRAVARGELQRSRAVDLELAARVGEGHVPGDVAQPGLAAGAHDLERGDAGGG